MDSPVQQIKDKLSINEIVGGYVQLQRVGRNFRAKCPFHKERTASFYVSPERGTYICFGCGEKGDVFSFVQRIEGIDFGVALKQLAEKAGVKLEKRFVPKQENKDKAERLYLVCEEAVKFFEATLKKRKDVRDYLQARGVKEETALLWRLGYAPAAWEELTHHLIQAGFTKEEVVDAGFGVKSEKKQGEIFDRFRGRIIFPLFDPASQVIAVSGRFFEKVPGARPAEGGEPAKYVNSPETALFKKSKTLYGFDRAKNFIRKADCILLVEGQLDLILAHQSGLPYTVALSGTALTPEHLSLLSRLSKRLVLALDGDAAGLRAGLKSAHMAIVAGFDVKIPAFPLGKDPADLAKENPELLKAAIRTSKTAVEFFLDALRPTARDERAYKKSIEVQVLPLIAAMGSKIEQEHFMHIVAGHLGVSEGAIRQEVAKVRATPAAPSGGEGAPAKEVAVPLSQIERTAGMLLFYFEKDEGVQKRLAELLGKERAGKLTEELAPHAEMLRFKFESEVGEYTDEATVAGDMLKQLEIAAVEEEIVASRGDARKITDLIRRKHELQK